MPEASVSPSEAGSPAHQALQFAMQLGPASDRLLRKPGLLDGVVAEIQAGRSLEDAVLGCVHRHLSGHRQLADEFAGYFLLELLRLGSASMSTTSKLRRFLDTGDLVLSVFGDLGGDFSDLHFDTAAQFKALFAQRMNWKAADQARKLNSGRRREDQRVADRPEELDPPAQDTSASPQTQAIRAEEQDRLILMLLRLEPRDRELLTLRLKGLPIDEIARTMGLGVDAARKAIDRAIARARRLATARPTGQDPAG